MADWNTRLMELAVVIGSWSKDRSTRTPGVGCIIVDDANCIVTTGYNGFPRGIMDDIDVRHERPEKYSWTVHAEPNAIANAARLGVSTVGCTAYVTKTPCSGCMALLIQAGIKKVVCPRPDGQADEWKSSRIAEDMADEAKVKIIWTETRNGTYCRSTHQSVVSV